MKTELNIEALPELDSAVLCIKKKHQWIEYTEIDGELYRVKGFYLYPMKSIDDEMSKEFKEKERRDKLLTAFFKKHRLKIEENARAQRMFLEQETINEYKFEPEKGLKIEYTSKKEIDYEQQNSTGVDEPA